MRISSIKIKNFRGLADATIPLSEHVCAIGPNNSGKSTFLISLSLFLSGSKLKQSDYYDTKKEIIFEACLEGISDKLLEQLAEGHRERIRNLVEGEQIRLVRRYEITGKSSLRCSRKQPKEVRFKEEEITNLMSGKKGSELKDVVLKSYPELSEKIGTAKTQKEFKELINNEIKQFPDDQLEYVECSLPTGIDKSIDAILPEAIYIPAVKDFSDEIKTRETTSFGKILRIVLELISDTEELKKINKSFEELKTLLNKEVDADGNVTDERLPQIKEVEEVVSKLLASQFPYAKLDLEIPPPELKTVFSSAQILVDDGIKDEIDTKGDGMKRAVTFALLRAYLEIKERQKNKDQEEEKEVADKKYLFLFEEPELYLHPKAQRTLYEALSEIAKDHHVCVSTHSPYFFGPDSTETFIRFNKVTKSLGERTSFNEARPIDLHSDIGKKDAFQILCFENNNAAFFCDQVVLCEGDSDLIFLKHASRKISDDWDFDRHNIALIQIGGKGNMARYREFFEAFDVKVQVIADLDAIIDQYKGLGASKECDVLRDELLSQVAVIAETKGVYDIKTIEAKSITSKKPFIERYKRLKELANRASETGNITGEEREEFASLFEEEKKYQNREILTSSADVGEKKLKLLTKLRTEGIHILSKGVIEHYYPDGIEGKDKPTKALNACKYLKSKDDVLELSETVEHKGKETSELEAIFDSIFVQ